MILVTGSTGLVGSHLLYKLVYNNEKVRAIYRSEDKLINVKNVFATYTSQYTSLFEAIEWVKADILNIPQLTEAFKDISYVYHCAAFVSFEPKKYHQLRRTNIEGSANVVNLCLSNNIKKICYFSSTATLGKSKNPITETDNWNPEDDNNVYAISKYGAEMEVWRAAQEGLNTVIVNPGVILGAGIWDSGSGSIFKRVHKGTSYYPIGNIGVIAIQDVVSISIKLLKSDIINERFVLVSENWTYKDFLKTIAKSIKVKPPDKKASPYLLQLIWRLDWIISNITGQERQLTKHIAKAISSNTIYSSEKIKTILNHEFKPIDETINSIGNLYLKQEQ